MGKFRKIYSHKDIKQDKKYMTLKYNTNTFDHNQVNGRAIPSIEKGGNIGEGIEVMRQAVSSLN